MEGKPHMPQTTAVEDLVRQLYRLGFVQRGIAREALSELGSQGFTALGVLHHGPVRVSELAQLLNVDLSVASRQVSALAAAGFVAREPDPDDRRAHRIVITDAGGRVLRESHRRMVHAFGEALEAWSAPEIAALAAGLERLREDFARTTSASPDPIKEATAR
jgi:DNA-binding MarR family transcriptional regulator